jgi:hypothetical protein
MFYIISYLHYPRFTDFEKKILKQELYQIIATSLLIIIYVKHKVYVINTWDFFYITVYLTNIILDIWLIIKNITRVINV